MARAEHLQQRLEALSRAAVQIQEALTPDDVLDAVGAQLERLGLQWEYSRLLPDGDRVVIERLSLQSHLVAAIERLLRLSLIGTAIPVGRVAVLCTAIRERRAVFADGRSVVVEAFPWIPHPLVQQVLLIVGLRGLIVAPLLSRGQVLGTLAVWAEDLAADDLPAVVVFAQQVAAAYDNARLLQESRSAAGQEHRLLHELQASEQRFRALIENSHDVALLLAPDGRILYRSPANERLTGYVAGEPAAGNLFDHVHPEDVTAAREALANVSREPGGQQRTEIRYRHRSGAWLVWEVVLTNRLADPNVAAVVVNARDVTERKRTQAEQEALARSEKLRALGQMASAVAHDLNQYLGLVVGHSELALREVRNSAPGLEAVQDSLRIVAQAAMDGAETVKRLLTFARPHQEGARIRLEPAALLREVAQMTAPQWRDAAQAQGRSISVHLDLDEVCPIDGWPEALREALTNLVFNAVDAMPRGGIIRLAARERGDRVVLEVSDNGVGMSADVRARIFEPFFTTKGERGTGLGLAAVFRIVDRHGGQIAVRSAPGLGTTFALSFPAANGAEPAGSALPPAPRTATRRILVVDDQVAIGRMAAAMLGAHGHTVVVATSGAEALARLADAEFDVVVSDVGMPGLSGWDLVERIRARGLALPIVLATGWGAAIAPEDARARGVRAIIAKPYRMADLERVLAALDEPLAERQAAPRPPSGPGSNATPSALPDE